MKPVLKGNKMKNNQLKKTSKKNKKSILYIQLKIIGEIAPPVPCHSRLTPHTGKAGIYIDSYLHTSAFSLNRQKKSFWNSKERYTVNYKLQFLIFSIVSS